jgi:hypothetical protein
VRGRDLSREAKAGSSSAKLVRDAATRPKTGRLASEGLDEDLHAFPVIKYYRLTFVGSYFYYTSK